MKCSMGCHLYGGRGALHHRNPRVSWANPAEIEGGQRERQMAIGLQSGRSMEANQRKYPRAPLSGTVKFFEWNRPFHADATEISANGLFVRTPASLSEG